MSTFLRRNLAIFVSWLLLASCSFARTGNLNESTKKYADQIREAETFIDQNSSELNSIGGLFAVRPIRYIEYDDPMNVRIWSSSGAVIKTSIVALDGKEFSELKVLLKTGKVSAVYSNVTGFYFVQFKLGNVQIVQTKWNWLISVGKQFYANGIVIEMYKNFGIMIPCTRGYCNE